MDERWLPPQAETSLSTARSTNRRIGWGSLLLALLTGPGAALGEPVSSWSLQDAAPTPSGSAVLEEEWAERLVDVLGLASTLPAEPTTEDLFSLLCVEKSELALGPGGRSLPADAAFRVAVDAPRRRSPDGPVRMVVSLPATALYQLVVEGVGLQRWVIDQEPVGHLDPSALGVAQARMLVALEAGPHEITAYLTPSARVDRMELSAYRSFCAAPADGWHQGRPLRHGAFARSVVRAFGFERRLPELSGEERLIEAESFDEVSGEGGVTERKLSPGASGGAWAAGLSGPAEFTWTVDLDEPRVVSIEARTHGVLPQLWSIDGRYRVGVEPTSVESGFAWNPIVTLPLPSGRHAVRALVARGSGVDALRIVSHRSSDADYVRVLEGLGLPGHAPESPVRRSEAESTLSSPAFAELAAGLRLELAGGTSDRSLALVEDAPDPLTSRTLSPMLPADL
jgi:hypothetical protein